MGPALGKGGSAYEAHRLDGYGSGDARGDAGVRRSGFRPGGCQDFGHSVSEDAKEFRPLGQNFVSDAAPLNDEALAEHEEFCG